ncbi:MAG: formate C-acetyltransferase/glycerol dehydratase family glycyl radical enzyme [Ruminococcaceae bacterium]|nr:formate C-acetyltransferase/glycerol dehydratase family glycyl radical enzyme [Oscillospiraceae bacterium]
MMTERIKNLKDFICSFPPEVFSVRAEIITESYKRTEGMPYVLRRAIAFKDIMEGIDIHIGDNEMIVGALSGKARGCQVFPEYDMTFVINEMDGLAQRNTDRFVISEEAKAKLREIYPYWQDKTVAYYASLEMTQEQKDAAASLVYILTSMRSGVGHLVIDYRTFLTRGVKGILEDVKANRTEENADYYDALDITLNAVCDYAKRYAALAESLLEKEENEERRGELAEIARVLKKVPYEPADSFFEAVQSFWIIHLALHLESSGHSMSPGRFDQYMYPFYEKDLQRGLTREQLEETLHFLWLKFFEINKIRDKVSTVAFGGYPMFQNLIVGGIDEDGREVVNDLSYLCLEATRQIALPQPSLSIRWNEKSDKKFLLAALDTVRIGGGMPAMFNDKTLIGNMLAMGYTQKEANDYCIVGCSETTGSGNVEPWLTGGFLNVAKVLELTIFNGFDPVSRREFPFKTGNVEDMSFEEFYGAFKTQLAYYLRLHVKGDDILDAIHGKYVPTPFTSAFLKGCIEKGRDNLNGGAKYNSTTLQMVAVPNVIDAIIAVKKFVYEEKTVSFARLKEALLSNFEGEEYLRNLLKNKSVKYGNDDDRVDLIGKDLVDFLYDEVNKYESPRGGKYRLALYTIASNVLFAKHTGATPDGRKAFDNLADGGVSAGHGRDKLGATALLNSVVKLTPSKMLGSSLLNLRLTPNFLTDENKEKIADLVRTYFKHGGQHIQFNVFDENVLRDAQKNPEKYPTLMVRVAGFSVLFTTIEKALQDDIIERTCQESGGGKW